jgi:LemA protein
MIFWIIVIVVILIVLWISYKHLGVFNELVALKNSIEYKFADIDVVMQRRTSIILALAQIAKKYGQHEYNTIKETIDARNDLDQTAPLEEKVEAFNAIEKGLFKVNALFEKYPTLKADKVYQQIMGDSNVSEAETTLQTARKEYNKIVNIYNTKVQTFPESIVANFYGFKTELYLYLGQDKYSINLIFPEE